MGFCLLSSFFLFRTRWVRCFKGSKVDVFHGVCDEFWGEL